MSKILVTGINGFVGKHLAREIHSQGHEVIGVGLRETEVDNSIKDIVHSYYQCDTTDVAALEKVPLENASSVINLAGLANVGASFDSPDLYMKVNVEVLSVLGACLLERSPEARMIAISTGALYDPNQPMPLDETSKVIDTGSPYALSKLAMEQSAQELREKGQDCVVVRPFNHIGPGQGLGFLIPDLVSKLQNYKESGAPVNAGNLKTVRDYSDVRDIACAYTSLAIAERLDHDLYNVCSGSGQSGEDIVRVICSALNIDRNTLDIEVDQSLIRPTDPQEIVGNHNRLSSDTGWQPRYSLDQTIKDIVNS